MVNILGSIPGLGLLASKNSLQLTAMFPQQILLRMLLSLPMYCILRSICCFPNAG